MNGPDSKSDAPVPSLPDLGPLDGANAPLASPEELAAGAPADTDASAPEELADVLARIEADPSPRDEHDFRGPFAALRCELEARGEPTTDVVPEEMAFAFHAQGRKGASAWGLYFGPLMSVGSPDGQTWETPALAMVTPDVLTRWRSRATATQHPVMRARYADLLWELSKKLDHARPDPEMARAAVDSYLDAVEGRRYRHDVVAVQNARRALALALEVGDVERVARVRDALIALEDAVAEDDSAGLWGFCFDVLVEPPNKKIPLSNAQLERLVGDMEARLARFVDAIPSAYLPDGSMRAALRLASHYRRRGRAEDVARVLRAYGGIVNRMRGTAAPLVVTHALKDLHKQYVAFGMHGDAEALHAAMREAGSESISEMKTVSASVEIPRQEVDAFFSALLEGTAPEVLERLGLHFVPRRNNLERELRDLAQKAPIQFLMSHTIVDQEGRTVATVGPLDEDFEGQYVRHVDQHLRIGAPWLREAIRRGFLLTDAVCDPIQPAEDASHQSDAPQARLSGDALMAFLESSPCFPVDRRPLLQAGVDAYVEGNAPVAIHLLVPQIEHALRQIAVAVRAPLYTQRRGGGFHARALDDLLRDEAVESAFTTAFGPSFGPDVVAYLRILLTDARGWNVRNLVCHGLAPVPIFSRYVADRVFHAALLLALLRWTGAAAKAEETEDP